jgi:hypothetical protein
LPRSRWQGDRIGVPGEAAIGITVDTGAGLPPCEFEWFLRGGSRVV